ncbi:MAG: hypothetical protein LBT04_09875 [Prevotellaceae bacterium]|jgi:hypothetical protein|nr:hypothetical protein [Prevotellaceae bacterium]
MTYKDLLHLVDTAAIYVEQYSYETKNKNSFDRQNDKNIYRTDYWYGMYKFYSKGEVNCFFFEDNYNILPKDLNPEYKGYRGVYYRENSVIKMDLFIVVGEHIQWGMEANILKFEGDTLLVKRIVKLDPRKVTVYVKRKLPKEYLIYKADW